MLKKKTISVVLIVAIANSAYIFTVALIIATANNAYAFTDATGGSWNDTLKFDGTITNTSPMWQFEVPADTVGLAKSLDIKQSDGVDSGSTTKWLLPTLKDAVVFQGNLKEMLPQGQAGLTPEIKIGAVKVSTSSASARPALDTESLQQQHMLDPTNWKSRTNDIIWISYRLLQFRQTKNKLDYSHRTKIWCSSTITTQCNAGLHNRVRHPTTADKRIV